jgi:PAS domain S-box-containing protein
MLTSSHTQNLAEYFRQSGRFYYAIIDRQGNFVYVNPLFRQQFGHIATDFSGRKATDFFSQPAEAKIEQVMELCMQNPGVNYPVDLSALSAGRVNQTTRWEFSANANDKTVAENIQAIGFVVDDPENNTQGIGHRIGELSERYKAYEESAEGLWMFESKDTVSVTDSPEAIIEYWKKNSFLAECNDNMARMYGFEKAEELIGATLESFMDFSDPTRLENLKNFIRNGFQSAWVETKEFDRHGNAKYFLNRMTGMVENGKIRRVWGTQQDLTEQRRLSQKLIEQEVQKQKLITQATIDGQEKERQMMGKELHDNINQHLTTTRLYLEVAREKASGEVLEMINHSHKTLAAIIYEIRQLSQSLVPPALGDIGLIESIQDLCDSLKRTHKFNIDFYSRYFTEKQLPENLKLMLFRITQEQVNNIVRHAQANFVQIKLQSDAEYIMLSIIDDGKGFDPAHYKKGQGFSNISNRASLFKGKMEVEASPGKGCALSVIIPLETCSDGFELI